MALTKVSKGLISTEQEIISIKERIKRASGDQRGRLKAKLAMLQNNLWLSKPWVAPKKSWWQVLHG